MKLWILSAFLVVLTDVAWSKLEDIHHAHEASENDYVHDDSDSAVHAEKEMLNALKHSERRSLSKLDSASAGLARAQGGDIANIGTAQKQNQPAGPGKQPGGKERVEKGLRKGNRKKRWWIWHTPTPYPCRWWKYVNKVGLQGKTPHGNGLGKYVYVKRCGSREKPNYVYTEEWRDEMKKLAKMYGR